MIFTGASFLLFWLLMDVFTLTVSKSALVTGIILIIAGLLIEGVPGIVRKP